MPAVLYCFARRRCSRPLRYLRICIGLTAKAFAFIDSLVRKSAEGVTAVAGELSPGVFAAPGVPKSYYTHIRIDPLQPQGAAEWLQDRIGDDASLRALKHLLIERTEGKIRSSWKRVSAP